MACMRVSTCVTTCVKKCIYTRMYVCGMISVYIACDDYIYAYINVYLYVQMREKESGNAMWFPGLDPGTETRTTVEKSREIWINSGVWGPPGWLSQ